VIGHRAVGRIAERRVAVRHRRGRRDRPPWVRTRTRPVRRLGAVVTVGVLVAWPLPAWSRPTVGTGHHPVVAGSNVTPRTPGLLPPDAIGSHRWPVRSTVVATWQASANPYGPGHRGVDLAVASGDPVAAMAGGVVGFAGVVAGRAWVSVDHPGGLRTTVGPLAVVAVAAGEEVRQGEFVGTAAGTAHADARTPRTGRLHVSARVDGNYVDPVPLVGPLVATLLPVP